MRREGVEMARWIVLSATLLVCLPVQGAGGRGGAAARATEVASASSRGSDLDWGAVRERTRLIEEAQRLEALGGREPLLAVEARLLLDRARDALGDAPVGFGRARFPWAPEGRDAERLRAAGEALTALEQTLAQGVLRARAAISAVADRAGTNGPLKLRLEAEGRALETRHAEARTLLRAAEERIDQRQGGFGSRARYWFAQMRGAGAHELLAELDASMRAWSGERPVLGAELTYVRGALRPLALPTNAIAPAYLEGDTALRLEDTTEGREVEQTAELAQKASELRTPAAAYEFVKNEFRLDWYYGSLKGSGETFRERRGNDSDLASVLIALLRAQGVPARYVRGTVEMPVGRVAELMGLLTGAELEAIASGVEAPAAARDRTLAALPAAGIPFSPVVSGGRVRAIRFVHTWVEAHLAYGNYRGAGADVGARQWIPLDPALPGGPKYAARPAAADAFGLTGLSAASLTREYLETGDERSPLDFVRSKVGEALAPRGGPSYSEVLRTVEQREERLGFVPGTLPYDVVAVHEESAFLPDDAKHRVRFVVSDASGAVLETTVPMHRLVGRRTIFAWEPASPADADLVAQYGGIYAVPASAVQIVPVLRVDGIPQVTGSRSLGLGAPTSWRMDLLLPDGSSRVVANQVIAGNFVAIGFGGPGNGYAETADEASYRDGAAARFLYARAAEYANAWTEAEEELARLLQVVPLRPTASVVLVENQLAVDEVLGVRRRVVWKGLQIDADHRTMVPLELVPGRDRELLRLSGFHGSYLEAQVLRQATGVESVAAVSVVQEAHRRGAPVLTITQANASAELARLTSSAAVRREVQDQVARGREVTIPAADLAIEGWNGTGFIARDPRSEEAGYFLSGIVSGGQTVVSPGSWLDAELVRILESPDAPNATDDTSRVARIILVSGAGQEVIVGRQAPQPFAVYVTTLGGIPVAGARVSFRSAGASRPLFADSEAGFGRQETLELRTDRRGMARAWASPDTSILTHAIVRQGNPHEELVGLNEIMAETEGPGTTKIALPRPALLFARHGAPSSVAMRCSLASPQNYCGRTYPAGLQMGLGIWGRVADEFGNWVPNYPVVWSSSQEGGRFVDLGKAGSGIRTLDPDDPAQAGVLTVKTSTMGEATTDYIPGPPPPNGLVDLWAVAGGAQGVFRLLVTDPGSSTRDQFAFRLRYDETADFAGIYGGRFQRPVGGQVFRWAPGSGGAQGAWQILTGREPGIERVQVQMDVWDVSAPDRKLLSTHFSEPWPTVLPDVFDDARTAAFWPAYEVDGGEQRHEFRARVTVANQAPVECAEAWAVQSESRRPTIETLRILPGWVEKPTDGFGFASRTDVAVAFRITNPAGYPIYARVIPRATVPGDALVGSPGDVIRHPTDPTLIQLLPHATTTMVLPLAPSTQGGIVELELHVPEGGFGGNSVRRLDYAKSPIRIVDPGVAIASGDDLLRAKVILLVRNFESSATPGKGEVAPDRSTELPFIVPARLEFRVKGSGLLSVTSGDRIVAQANVAADPDTGEVLSIVPVGADIPAPSKTAQGSLLVEVGPGDPTVQEATIRFRDQVRELPFRTFVEDLGALPVGHTFVKDVSVVDGHVVKSATDISIPGRGGGLSFSRTYTSRGSGASPLGSGWAHSYHSFVVMSFEPGRARYVVVGGEGSGQAFVCTSGSDCKPQRGYHGTLTVAEGRVVYRARSGTEYHYARADDRSPPPRLWLTGIVDPRGNTTTLEYGDASIGGELLRVYEPGNRRLLQFAYEWPEGGSRRQMTKVELLANPGGLTDGSQPLFPIDEPGVCVGFRYDARQNLASATRYDGSCSEGPGGGEGVARREEYAYAAGTIEILQNEILQNNLVRYTDPNGRVTEYLYYAKQDTVPGEGQYLLMGDKAERVKEVREPAPGGATRFEFSLVPKARAVLGEVHPLYETKVTYARPGSVPTVYRMDAYGAASVVERGAAARTTRWDPIRIRPVEETDPRGRRVTMRYDARGNLVERRTAITPLPDPSGGHGTEPLLDSGGKPIAEIVERWAYDPDYAGETCHLDPEGRLTVTEYSLGLPVRRREFAEPLATSLVAGATDCTELAAQARPSAGKDHVTAFTYCGVNDLTCAPALAKRGDLVETTDGPRRTTVTAYDAYGQAKSLEVAVSTGRSLVAERRHDSRGRLRFESDTVGHELHRGYDALDRLTSIERVNGKGGSPGEYRSFEFHPGGQLRAERIGTPEDPGAFLERTFELDGLNLPEVVTEKLANGETLVTTTRHDAIGNAWEVVDRRGVRRVTSFDGLDRPTEVKLFVDDPTFERPDRGGDLTGFVAGRRLVLVEYDAAGNKVAETDHQGRRTEFRLDSLYRAVRVIAPPVPGAKLEATAPVSYETRRKYDRVGNKLEETDGNGNATRWSYDFANRVLRTVDPVGRFESRSYDGLGQVEVERKGVLSAAGVESTVLTRTSKGYDGLGRSAGWKERFRDIDGAERLLETDLAYDDVAHAVEERDRRGAVARRLLDDLDRVYDETLDDAGSKLARSGDLGFPPQKVKTTYEYDLGGNPTAVTDPLGRRRTEVRDGLGRLTLRTLPMGVTEGFRYDGEGNVVWSRDRRGVETRRTYDPLGRETRQLLLEAVSGPGGELAALTRQYLDTPDPEGLVSVLETDALGRSTTRYLDGLRREVRTKDAKAYTVRTAYDALRRRAVQDRRGLVTEYHADGAGRPTAQRELGPDGSLAFEQSWSYDDAAQKETFTDRRGTPTVTERDGLGRARKVTRGAGADVQVTVVAFDGNGNPVRTVDPNDHATESAYDGANRKRTETRGAGTAVASAWTFRYDAAGNRTETKGPRGTWAFDVRESYDDLDRSVRTEVPTGDSAHPYAVTTRAFDAAGNQLCEKRPLGGDPLAGGTAGMTLGAVEALSCAGEQVTRYRYDELSKLVSVVDADLGEHSFVYDAVRNLVAKQDANGSLTTYGYDRLNRRTDEWQHLDAHPRIRSRAEVPDAAGEGPADPSNERGALRWRAVLDPN